ncbi:MAG: hypothetical protein NTY48_03195 [Candidatus Diapherotrites archaeon]|nr:hypothetical protein [Candidatus Diapherotrites archaeon]
MARFLIITKYHPTETVSFSVAWRLVEYLKKRGHEVELKSMPFKVPRLMLF